MSRIPYVIYIAYVISNLVISRSVLDVLYVRHTLLRNHWKWRANKRVRSSRQKFSELLSLLLVRWLQLLNKLR